MERTPLKLRLWSTRWAIQLIDNRTGRVLRAINGHNDQLNAGVYDVHSQITGQRGPAIYQWVEIGTSPAITQPAVTTGCIAPVLLPDNTPARVRGAWSTTGSDFTLDVAIPGAGGGGADLSSPPVTGNIFEAALYPSQQANLGQTQSTCGKEEGEESHR